MGVDTCPAISVPRPSTLLLENNWKSQDNNNNMKMVETNNEVNVSRANRRRKKKRAADAGVKKFEGNILSWFYFGILLFNNN